MIKIAILGSTGSIGTQTLDIVRKNKDLQVLGLAAGRNISMLEEQIREFSPRLAAVGDEEKAAELRERVKDTDCKVVGGMDGLLELAAMEGTQILVTAIVGMIGIRPTIEGIKAGKDIALANKETLVTAGHIIMPLAEQYGVRILPVDSEHSAIFQALNGEEHKTIDSATLVNKGLEVMEAKWLFGVDLAQIQVVVQPQSVIHSMIRFTDGSVMAQLGTPDMRLPIQYALYGGTRRYLDGERLDFAKLGSITFENPDMETFKGLPLAMKASRTGGSMPTVFNAANEKAVALFLQKKIAFLDIYRIIEDAMESHKVIPAPTVEEILNIEQEIYNRIESRW